MSFSNSTAPPASFPVNNYAFCFIPGIASNSFFQARFINQLLQSCLPPPGTLCMSFVNDSSQTGLIAKTPSSSCGTKCVAGTPGKPNMQTAQFPPILHFLLCPLSPSDTGQLFIQSAISPLVSLLIKGNVY